MSKGTKVPGYMQGKGSRNPRGIIGDREIRYKCSLQNTILDVLRGRPGWQEVPGQNNIPQNVQANPKQQGQQSTGQQPSNTGKSGSGSTNQGTTFGNKGSFQSIPPITRNR
eukprot:XP_011456952.1 PREDICTED: uncharacterized protein LOC105349007 isoform X2 [Crassostrea gigas]